MQVALSEHYVLQEDFRKGLGEVSVGHREGWKEFEISIPFDTAHSDPDWDRPTRPSTRMHACPSE